MKLTDDKRTGEHSNPRTKKEEMLKIIKMIDSEQVKDEKLDESKVNEPTTIDPTFPDYAEEKVVGTNVAEAEKAGTEEIDKSTRSKRFSREHEEVSEEELRKNKKLNAKAGGKTN